jgi:hypothetical protein
MQLKAIEFGLRAVGMTRRVMQRRRGVAALAVALSLPFAVLAEPKPDTSKLKPADITVSAAPISSFNRLGGSDSGSHFGALEFLGGLVLTAPDTANFGGWSGLVLDSDGKGFLAVSDAGTWLRGRITYKDGKLAGISDARLGPIRAQGDKALKKRKDRDAEAIALVSGTVETGDVLISFEQNTRIARYQVSREGLSPPLGFLAMPKATRGMRRNNGLEAMTVMRGGPHKGEAVAMSERLMNLDHNHTGWIWSRGEAKAFHLTNIGDFDITDIASLEDGTLFVLERRFRWLEGVKMRIRRINAGDLKPGVTIEGDKLIEANMEHEIDNMEGLALHRSAAGETILTLISDNNFNSYLQRTLLLQFALKDTQTVKARPER